MFILSNTDAKEEQEAEKRNISPETKKIQKELRVQFLNNNKKEVQAIENNPSLTKEEKEARISALVKAHASTTVVDLTKIIKIFGKEAISYKHKSSIEDTINLVHNILSESEQYQLNSEDKPRWHTKLNDFLKTKDEGNYTRQLDYIIETFYGERKKKGGTSKISKFGVGKFKFELLTKEEKDKKKNEIEYIKNSNLEDEEKQRRIKEVESSYKRYFNYVKFFDNFLQYIQIKAMGWNPFSAINNVVYGWLSNYTYASGGVDFDNDEMRKANLIMLSRGKNEKKVEALMVKYDTLKEIFDTAYMSSTDNNRLVKGLKQFGNPLILQKKGEYFVQGQTMVALMLATKVNINGKEYSVWDSYDENVKWKHENKEQWGEGNVNVENSNKEYFNFKVKLDQIIKRIHGNYDPNSAILIKKYALGRALLQFRSWVAEGVSSRFEVRDNDLLLGREREGRYRTAWNLGVGNTLKTLFLQAIYRNNNKAFTHLDLEGADLELVKENMKRNLTELWQKVVLVTLAMIVAGFDDDDDEWKKMARNGILNNLYRIGDDIDFYLSPTAFDNITRSPLAVLVFMKDTQDFLDATAKALRGEDTIETGVEHGQSRVLKKGLKLIPGGSAYVGIKSKLESAETFRK